MSAFRFSSVVTLSVGSLAGKGAQQDGDVADGPAHRAGRVLRLRNRDHAGPAHEADGRLHAYDSVGRRRGDDRSVGLGADCDGAKVGGNSGARSGARSTRVAIERVGILGQPAAAAPAAGGVATANVGPLAEIGLAQDDGTGVAQRRTRNASSGGRASTSASEPAVVCMRSAVSMLSLISTGMPCSGPRGPFALRSLSNASAISRASGLNSITLLRAGPFWSTASMRALVFLDERTSSFFARLHRLLQVADGQLVQLERLDLAGGLPLGPLAFAACSTGSATAAAPSKLACRNCRLSDCIIMVIP